MSMKTKVPPATAIKVNADGTITKGLKHEVWKAVLAELEATIVQLNDATDNLASQNALNSKQNTDISQKMTLISELNARNMEKDQTIGKHVKTIQQHENEITKLVKANKKLEELLEEAHQALKDGGRHCASEQDETVKKHLSDYVKGVTFRTTKFARGDKLDRLTKDIYEGMAPTLGWLNEGAPSYLPEDEFSRIYTSRVTFELNRRRQYVQTQMLQAFQSKSSPFVGFVGLFACQVPL